MVRQSNVLQVVTSGNNSVVSVNGVPFDFDDVDNSNYEVCMLKYTACALTCIL